MVKVDGGSKAEKWHEYGRLYGQIAHVALDGLHPALRPAPASSRSPQQGMEPERLLSKT